MSDKELSLAGQNLEYEELLQQVGITLEAGRRSVANAVNTTMVRTYWEIGKYIVIYEQHGREKAEYGSELLKKLSRDLTDRYGKGFSWSNVYRMRQMYEAYPTFATVSQKLTWSHYIELLKIDDPLERAFYEKETENEHWGVRELKRQMDSMLFRALPRNTKHVRDRHWIRARIKANTCSPSLRSRMS